MNNEALTEHLFGIAADIGEIKANSVATLAETRRTNGRVTKLEELTAEMAKLVSHHSGQFEQMVVEHRAVVQLIEAKEQSFMAELAAWKAERDAKYAAESAARKVWMDRLWVLLKFLIPIGVAATLATLGIEALPNVPTL